MFSLKEPIFTGVATAIVTPFSDGGIDFNAYDVLLDRQLAAGIPAIVVTGTTGEASTLSAEEKHALWRRSVARSRGRCKVIAGVGSNCTATAVEQAVRAEDCGVDALLAVTPYYNKCTQEGLVQHYTAIADATSLPLILYDVPSRTGVHILPETCSRLAAHPKINGIKYAGGNIVTAAEICRRCGNALHLWCGNDDQCVPTLAVGGIGLISVLSNLLPRETMELCRLYEAGDHPAAAALQRRCLPLISVLFAQPNPIPVKTALEYMGLCRRELRLPLTALSDTEAAPLRREMAALGL